MMKKEFPDGVWPVMLTPFTDENKVDYESLGKLVDWYIENGAAGLFADCQSSEMFFLSLEERVKIAEFVKNRAGERIPVVASGHISDSIEEQARELKEIAKTGVDALILLTNRLAREEEDDVIWLKNLKQLISMLPEEIPLGFYECPYPYKRIITPELLKWCVESKRFFFIKDTSCDLDNIKQKLKVIQGSTIKLFNANSATLLETLQMGASGFSGVMANFHTDLYMWLCKNYKTDFQKSRILADFLTIASFIERQVYPVNAKYCQKKNGNFQSMFTRTKDAELLNDTGKLEVDQLMELTEYMRDYLKTAD